MEFDIGVNMDTEASNQQSVGLLITPEHMLLSAVYFSNLSQGVSREQSFSTGDHCRTKAEV